MKASTLTQDEIHQALGLAANWIEMAGASPELTDAVCMVAEIRSAIGNRWNKPDHYAAERVRKTISQTPPPTQVKTPAVLLEPQAPGS